MEEQLAGLRILLSRGILDDPLLATTCFRRLPLSDDTALWQKLAGERLQKPAPARAAALSGLRESPMEMDRALAGLRSHCTLETNSGSAYR